MDEKQTIREQLSAYMDGELSAAEARRVEQAVAADAELAAELAAIRATRDLVRELPRERAPSDMAQRVLAKARQAGLLDSHKPAPVLASWASQWLRPAAVAAAVLLAVGAITLFVGTRQEQVSRAPSVEPAQDKGRLARELADEKSQKAPEIAIEPPAPAAAPVAKGGDAKYYKDKDFGAKDLEEAQGNAGENYALNNTIVTDDLAASRKEVTAILHGNGSVPMGAEELNDRVARQDMPKGGSMGKAGPVVSRAGNPNFYTQVNETPGKQVQLLVIGTPEQIQRINGELNAYNMKNNLKQNSQRQVGQQQAAVAQVQSVPAEQVAELLNQAALADRSRNMEQGQKAAADSVRSKAEQGKSSEMDMRELRAEAHGGGGGGQAAPASAPAMAKNMPKAAPAPIEVSPLKPAAGPPPAAAEAEPAPSGTVAANRPPQWESLPGLATQQQAASQAVVAQPTATAPVSQRAPRAQQARFIAGANVQSLLITLDQAASDADMAPNTASSAPSRNAETNGK